MKESFDALFKELAAEELDQSVRHRHVNSLRMSKTSLPKRRQLTPYFVGMALISVLTILVFHLFLPLSDRNSAYSTIEPYRTVIAQTNQETLFRATLPTRPEAKEILLEDRKWKSTLHSLLLQLEEVQEVPGTLLFDFAIYTEDSSITRFKVYETLDGYQLKDVDTSLYYSTTNDSLFDLVTMMRNTYN